MCDVKYIDRNAIKLCKTIFMNTAKYSTAQLQSKKDLYDCTLYAAQKLQLLVSHACKFVAAWLAMLTPHLKCTYVV